MALLRTELKGLLKHGSIYFLGTVLSRLVGFLMIPVYTHYLTPTDYGINTLVGLTIEIVGIVIGLGISGSVYRFYYDYKNEKERNKVVSTACIGIPITGFIGLGIICINSVFLASIILDNPNHWIYICLAMGSLWFNQQVNLVYTYLRVREFSGYYLLLSLSKLIVALVLNIFFIVILKYGVLGLFLSNIITAGLFFIIFYPVLLYKIGLNFSFSIAKQMLRFSLPIIPANLASLAVSASDRFFIKAFFSIADAGIYGLGYKFGNVVFYFIRAPFMQIWEPRRYALYRENAPVEIYAKIMTYFVGLMVFAGLGISIFIFDIIKIISPEEFWGAAPYVPAIVLTYVIYAMDHHVAFGILIKKRTEYWTYVNLSMAAINLLLNFLLIPAYGPWGAIVATFISIIYKITFLHRIARKFLRIPFEWYRMTGMFFIAFLVFFVSRIYHPESLVLAFVFDSFITLLYLPLLWTFKLITMEEKKEVLKYISNFLRRKTKLSES